MIARVAPEGLAVDELAEAIVERGFLRLDRARFERRLDAQAIELFHRVREDVDPDADRADLRSRLEEPARDPGPVQLQSERQPADPGADDDDVVIGHGSLPAPQAWRDPLPAVRERSCVVLSVALPALMTLGSPASA